MKMLPSKQQSSQCRQIHTGVYLSCHGEFSSDGEQVRRFLFPRKVSQGEYVQIVPITDTGGLVEKTQGSE